MINKNCTKLMTRTCALLLLGLPFRCIYRAGRHLSTSVALACQRPSRQQWQDGLLNEVCLLEFSKFLYAWKLTLLDSSRCEACSLVPK